MRFTIERREKLAKAREKGIEVENDEDLDLIDDLDDDEMEEQLVEVKKTSKVKKTAASSEISDLPEIETTKDGKQRCPRCKKEFASVARHITRCKYAQGPEDIEAIKLASSKLKK